MKLGDVISVAIGGAIVYRVCIDVSNGHWLYAAVGILLLIVVAATIGSGELDRQMAEHEEENNRRELLYTPCFDKAPHPPHEWEVPYTGTVPDIKVPTYTCPGKDYGSD